jgi:cbb3-type cytochrome oxidase subunit 3
MLDRVKFIISSEGVNNLGVAMMLFFFVLLMTIFIVTLKRKKSYDEYDARLPLEEDDYIDNKN